MNNTILIQTEIPNIQIDVYAKAGTTPIIIRCSGKKTITTTSGFVELDLRDLLESVNAVLTEHEERFINLALTYLYLKVNDPNNTMETLFLKHKNLTADDIKLNDDYYATLLSNTAYDSFVSYTNNFLSGTDSLITYNGLKKFAWIREYRGTLISKYRKTLKQYTQIDTADLLLMNTIKLTDNIKPKLKILMYTIAGSNLINIEIIGIKFQLHLKYIANSLHMQYYDILKYLYYSLRGCSVENEDLGWFVIEDFSFINAIHTVTADNFNAVTHNDKKCLSLIIT